MKIAYAGIEDSAQILSLQKTAYRSEAVLYGDYAIPPLTQTIEEISEEFKYLVFLKAVHEKIIIGSVRASSGHSSCFIGRLIVHPDWQGKGIGTGLMQAAEGAFPDVRRYELFTGTKSARNIRFYQHLGYRPFKEQIVHEGLSFVYLEKFARTAGYQDSDIPRQFRIQ